ncbi:MAG: redoxin [Chloracidobacterium sp. CP2_5A]|nr:MAG: redoxin [Chloracidobacterium sp. CP2_5A]
MFSMKAPTRWLLTLTLALAGFSTLASPAPQSGAQSAAPDFTAPSLTDETDVRLSSLRGKVVALNFWASWCPPCRAEFPLLAKLHNAYKERGFVLLSLNLGEDAAAARRFIQRETPPFQVYVGASAAAKYDASRLPMTYFIDRAGRIRRQVAGFHPKRSEAEFTALIDALLAEPAPQ